MWIIPRFADKSNFKKPGTCWLWPVSAWLTHALHSWWCGELKFHVTASATRSKDLAKSMTILLTNENYGLVTHQCIINTWLASGSMLADNLQMLHKNIKVNNLWFSLSLVFLVLGTFFLEYFPLQAWEPLKFLLFPMLHQYRCMIHCSIINILQVTWIQTGQWLPLLYENKTSNLYEYCRHARSTILLSMVTSASNSDACVKYLNVLFRNYSPKISSKNLP